MSGKSTLDDCVLGEVAGGEREAGQGDGADQHHQPGFLQVRIKAAHLAHVLFIGHGMDDGTGTEEQQGLEKGVGEEMENADTIGAHAHGNEHVTELRTG